MSEPVLELSNLSVSFGRGDRRTTVVNDVSLCIEPGEIVGIVGESGSGKTLTAMAAADLLPTGAEMHADRWMFEGHDLSRITRGNRGPVLGGRLAVVFQDPMSSLNPARTVGAQMSDVVRVHHGQSRQAARATAVDRLREVRVTAPERRVDEYPHEFSGGMRQRAMIAMGLMTPPALLIADEPTTALDVTVQADVMSLIAELNREHGTAVILVSHNIALIAEVATRVLVMYAGRIVEEIDAGSLATSSRHRYTRALIGSVPRLDAAKDQPLVTIVGAPPDPSTIIGGCSFSPRCTHVSEECRSSRPALVESDAGLVACVHPAGDDL